MTTGETNGQVDLVKLGIRRIEPRKLKLRDLAEIERLVGHKVADEITSGDLGFDTMQGMLWIELRKHVPDATFEDAGEYDLGQLNDLLRAVDEDDAGPPPSPPSSGNGASTNAVSPAAGNSKPSRHSATSTG